jgi:hypothetical protein
MPDDLDSDVRSFSFVTRCIQCEISAFLIPSLNFMDMEMQWTPLEKVLFKMISQLKSSGPKSNTIRIMYTYISHLGARSSVVG